MKTIKILGLVGSIVFFIGILLNFLMTFFLTEEFLLLVIYLVYSFMIAGLIIILITTYLISKKLLHDSIFYDSLFFGILWISALIIPLFQNYLTQDIMDINVYFWILFIIGLIVRVLYMIGAEYFNRSLDLISIKTKTGLFTIAGNLYIAGTVLIFVLYIIASLLGAFYIPLIGAIFLVIAALLQTIAFTLLPKNITKNRS